MERLSHTQLCLLRGPQETGVLLQVFPHRDVGSTTQTVQLARAHAICSNVQRRRCASTHDCFASVWRSSNVSLTQVCMCVLSAGWLRVGSRVAAAGATTSTPVARAGERTVSRTRGAKQTDEGKLRKVSGRLFPESSGRSGGSAVAQGGGDVGGAPRRSSRLSAMATTSERQVRLLCEDLGGRCQCEDLGGRCEDSVRPR
jgi:hypothetical protein